MHAQSPRKLDRSYARGAVAVKVPLAETMSGGSDMDTQGRSLERSRQEATLRSVDVAANAEDAAHERWAKNNQVFDTCAKTTKAARKKTEMEMGDKIHHTEVLKQDLIVHSKKTAQKMAQVQKHLGLTAEKISALEATQSACQQRLQARSERPSREHIADEVTEALHNQQRVLDQKRYQLEQEMRGMNTMMEDLGQQRVKIVRDINSKDGALQVDRGCAGTNNLADTCLSFGHSKISQGQRSFADTTSSKMRQQSWC